LLRGAKDVGARHKAGHDDREIVRQPARITAKAALPIDLPLRDQNDTDFPGRSDDLAIAEGRAMNDQIATTEPDLRDSEVITRRLEPLCIGSKRYAGQDLNPLASSRPFRNQASEATFHLFDYIDRKSM
jgi:hypothetical protein